jgi:hypothetical protein
MTSGLDSVGRSESDRAKARAYGREFWPGMAAYALVLVAVLSRRVDEYQKLLLLQSLAVGFAVAMLAAITLGLLATAGLRLADAPWIVYGAGMLGWALTGIYAGRR